MGLETKTLPKWEELKAEWQELLDAIEEAKRDDGKIGIGEAFKLAGVLVDGLVQYADGFDNVPGAEKKEWVISITWDIYKGEVDLDIPYIPDPLETLIEKALIKCVVPQLIELFVRARRGITGLFRKHEAPEAAATK